MRKLIRMHFLYIASLASVTACSTLAAGDSKSVMANEKKNAAVVAEEAINFCVSEFEKRRARKISSEIDHVAPIVAPDKIDMLFTRGEAGNFSVQDHDLKPFFSCGVLRESPLRLYFLLDLESGALIPLIPDDDRQREISHSVYSETIWHLLFVRKNGGFQFSKLKKFDPVEYQNKRID